MISVQLLIPEILYIILSRLENFVGVNGDISVHATSQFGIPQGSILGPLFPPLKMLPMDTIILKQNISFY